MKGIVYRDDTTGQELHFDKFDDEITIYIVGKDGIAAQVYISNMNALSIAGRLQELAHEQELEKRRKASIENHDATD